MQSREVIYQWRKRIFEIIEVAKPEDKVSRAFDLLNMLTIVINLIVSLTYTFESMREKYGMTKYWGDSVEFHASGAVTIPCIGTKAPIDEKLAYDPTREKRRAIYEEVKALFPEYTVFVGGSSSFDMVPAPYDKYYALDVYCRENGLTHENVLYVGDDYGPGGNDEAVFKSDFAAVAIDDYRTTPEILKFLL